MLCPLKFDTRHGAVVNWCNQYAKEIVVTCNLNIKISYMFMGYLFKFNIEIKDPPPSPTPI